MKFKVGNKRENRIVEFNNILPDIFEELNLKDSFIIEKIRDMWEDIIGTILSTHTIPDRIFKKTLFVSVDHSVYANELILMKDIIVEKINSSVVPNLIKNVKVEMKKSRYGRK